jgi:hypothetical protein
VSETSSLPIIAVCTTKKQAVDFHKLNELCGKLTTVPIGLPRIHLFLKSIGDFDHGLLNCNSDAWYAVWELHYNGWKIHRMIFTKYMYVFRKFPFSLFQH